MSITAHYPRIPDLAPAYNGEGTVETPKPLNAFAEWPRNNREAHAAPRTTDTGTDRGALSEPMPFAHRQPAAGPRDPLIAAYRAAAVDMQYLDGRLEDDDALMTRLAAASGLYAATPAAPDLTAAERRRLTADLVGALTRHIDWKVALGPDPDAPDAPYYDGLTLRNATGKPLAKVLEIFEARIGRVLRSRGIAQSAGIADCAGLARQVRRTMTADPTLSLQPPPDVAYGSPRWIALWTGMRTLADQGLAWDRRETDDLVAIGRAAIVQRAQENAAGSATTATLGVDPGVDMGGLLLMAHAAGKLDLCAVARGQAAITAEQLTAYYKEVFADELRLIDALAALSRAKPPTSARLAHDNLLAAGIDPDHQIDVDSLFIPFPYGSSGVTVPLPFTVYKQSVCDFYVAREKLAPELVATLPRQDAAAPAGVPDPLAHARAKLAHPLMDQIDAAFDRHKISVAEHIATIIDASISRYGRDRGIDVGNASVTVSRAKRRIVLDGPGLIASLPTFRLDEKDSDGYFVSIDMPAGKHVYFLSFKGEEFPLPAGAALQDWSRNHEHVVFGTNDTPAGADEGLLNELVEFMLSHTDPANQVAAGTRTEIADRIRQAVPATLERQRAEAYGHTGTELMREIERSLIPFRSTYLAIRDGDLDNIQTTVMLDTLVFIPAMGEGLSLGLRAGEALAAGLERGLASFAQEGLLQAIKLGAGETASFAPALGRQAAKVVWTAAKNAIVNPLDLLAAIRGGGRLGLKGVQAVAERLKATRPVLAKELLESAGKTEFHDVLDGQWILEAMPDAAAKPGDAASRGEPLYRTATARGGSHLPLQRYGANAYTAYNPQTLAPVGPLFAADAQGALHRTLPVDALQRYRITDPILRASLDASARSEDGTIMLGAKRYAGIHGDYLELLPDHPTTTSSRPIWRIAGAGHTGARSDSLYLYWDKNLGAWRQTEPPGLKGGGSAGSKSKAKYVRLTEDGDFRILPTDEQLTRFYDTLVTDIRGGATAAQVKAVRSALSRIEADPRGKAILRAMCARHDLLGQAPTIVLRDTADLAQATPSSSHALAGPVWFMDLGEAAEGKTDALIKSSALAYDGMTHLLGARKHPFDMLLKHGKPPLDPELQRAWSLWFKANDDSFGTAATVIHTLRRQLQEARCFGGLDQKRMTALIRDAIEMRPPPAPLPGTVQAAPYGIHITLNFGHAYAETESTLMRLHSLPALPDDVEELELIGQGISDLSGLPRGLKSLNVQGNKLKELPRDLPTGLIALDVSGNRLTSLPESWPPGLVSLSAHGNSLRWLPTFPGSLKHLRVGSNGLKELPADLPPGLELLHAPGNALVRLPDNLPSSLVDVRLGNNLLTSLPPNIGLLTSATIHLENNPIPPKAIPRFAPGQPGPRFSFFGST